MSDAYTKCRNCVNFGTENCPESSLCFALNYKPFYKAKTKSRMKKKNVLKFIGNEILFMLALAVFIGLVTALGTTVLILLALLGRWIGIGYDIFTYCAGFCIFWKVWDGLAWIVGWIADRNERKEERGYFERLNKEE